MRSILAVLALLLAISTQILAQNTRPIVQDEDAQSNWREDLHYLADHMPTIHPNLFWRVSEADFDQAIVDLDANIPYLTDEQIKVELIRLVALIDGHTNIFPFQSAVNFHLYPIRLYWFSDGMYVIESQSTDDPVIGKRLVRVGDSPIESLVEILAPLAQRDNPSTIKLLTPLFLVIPEVLHALGVIDDVNHPHFVFEDQTVLDLEPQSLGQYTGWSSGGWLTGLPARPTPLYLSHHFDQAFWYTYLDKSKTLYIQYNLVRRTTQSGQTITAFAHELSDFVAGTPVDRVVIDIRNNPGGDNTTYSPFLNFFLNGKGVNGTGKLFVITGRQTFSAAANFTTELEQKTDAVFVGEPMGGSPNLYGDVRPIRLPHSGIQADVSARYWQKSSLDDKRDTIEPDIPVALSSTDFFEWRDPVLDAILLTKND